MSTASSVGSSVGKAVASSVGVGSGGGFDADAVAYFAAVEAAGGSFDLTGVSATYTTSYVKKAHSDLFAGLKADGLWTKVTELYLLSGKTYAGMAVKAKGSGTLTLTNFVSGDYVSAGSGAGLNSGGTKHFSGSTLDVAIPNTNFHHLSMYLTESAGSAWVFGVSDSANRFALRRVAPSRMIYYPGTLSSETNNFNGSLGFWIGTRNNTTATLYLNGGDPKPIAGLSPTTTVGSKVLQSQTENDAITQRIAIASAGATALTDTDASNLSSRVNTFMTSLGANVY